VAKFHDPAARRLGRLTTEEVALLDKSSALVVLPMGAIEQHGPHLPCDTDILVAQAVVDRTVAATASSVDLWTLPPLAYGKSNEHLDFPGTVSLATETLLAVCRDLANSVARSGFRKLAFVNGHGGQPQLLEVVARDIREITSLEVFPIFLYRLGIPEGIIDDHHAAFDLHGGVIETSMVLALDPGAVRLDRLDSAVDERARELSERHRRLSLEGALPTTWLTKDVSTTGVIGDPRGASAEWGERIVGLWVESLAAAFEEICGFAF
jgi:creatinine amidohydrolase